MLSVKFICLFFFFSLPNTKPAFINFQKWKDLLTKQKTPPPTTSDKQLNITLPSIETYFDSNPQEETDLLPISMKGHHVFGSVKTKCPETSTAALLSRLGTGFNVRYMSVNKPASTPRETLKLENGFQQDEPMGYDTEEEELDFYVESDFLRELEEDEHHRKRVASRTPTEEFIRRIRRSVKSKKRKSSHRFPNSKNLPWKCPTKLIWRDLGTDHFPQFLRSVRCETKHCWYSHFRCVPKAFTIKVLKRKSDDCVPVPSSDTTVTQYEQHWTFEERAVTFCCECVNR